MKTFDQQMQLFADWLDKQELSPGTKRIYLSRLRSFNAFLSKNEDAEKRQIVSIAQAVEQLIDDYKQSLKCQNASAKTINTSLSAMASFGRFAGIQTNKASREALSVEEQRALSEDEEERFMRVVSAYPAARDRAIVYVHLFAGARIGECVRLNVDDVTSFNGGLALSLGAGKTQRLVPLDPCAAATLTEWIEDRTEPVPPHAALFLSYDGNRLSISGTDAVVRKIGIKAGLVLSTQVLRNTYLKRLVGKGVHPMTIAYLGGYSTGFSARRYADSSTSA